MANVSLAISAFENTRKIFNSLSDVDYNMRLNMKLGLDGSFYRKDARDMIKLLESAERNMREARRSLE